MPRLRLRYFVPLAVLVLGAGLPAAPALASPASGTWTATGNLNTARFDDTSTLLQNGNVLIAAAPITRLRSPAPSSTTPPAAPGRSLAA
jgi:hypothetical protein